MTTAWQAFAATKNAKRPATEDDRMTAISWATKALEEEVKGLTTVPPVLHWGLIHTKQLKQDIIGPLLWRSLNAATRHDWNSQSKLLDLPIRVSWRKKGAKAKVGNWEAKSSGAFGPTARNPQGIDSWDPPRALKGAQDCDEGGWTTIFGLSRACDAGNGSNGVYLRSSHGST
ncbi:hypothetical protein CBOM_05875 [Ceraceosorus bombacis]|uniref:Uncharacterized protein n=1 Tax=Ceraceosorus bombacis TaxID=401625 RepID=A0A0P1BRU4_9BASI|nr:hypothetical protein CBOM_05875 [Ceraceosorus bombacis]